MSPVLSSLTGIALTLVLSLVAVVHLRPHLRTILVDLCGSRERAAFWTAFSNVSLVLLPLICALFHRPGGGPDGAAFFDVSAQLRWSLIGLLLAVLMVGWVVGRFIVRVERT